MISSRKINLTYYALSVLVSATLNVITFLRFTPLYDFSYFVNVAGRLRAGQIPYRDFDLTTTPGTYYVVKAYFSFFGWNSFAMLVLSTSITIISTTATSYLVSVAFKNSEWFSKIHFKLVTCLMISLTGVNAIIAFPFYDNFAITSVIISFSLIIYSRQKKYFSSIKIIAGLVCFTPLLFKQNIGLFYLFGLIVVLSLQVIKSGYGPLKSFLARKMFPYLLGASFALALLLVLFLGTPYRKEIFYDTFTYSGKIKGVFTKTELFNFFDRTYIFIGLIILCIVSIFKYRVVRIVHLMFLIITLLVSLMGIYLFAVNQSLGLFNFGTPKLVSLWILALGIPIFFCRSFEIVLTNKSFEYLILVCLFVLFGAYLSQGFSGSSYAVGPIILIVLLSQFDAVKDSSGKILTYLSFLGILSYAVWVQLYGLSGLQLQNPNLTTGKHAGHFGHDTFSYLGIAKNDMQDLIDLRKEIFDYKGSVIQVPAEDPLPFLLNNYKPWGRCSQNIFVVCTSANRERMRIIDSPPSLIIVKKLPQWTFDWEPLSDQIIIALEKCNTPSKIIGRYLLYEKFKLNDCFVSTLRHEITRVL